MAAALLAVPAFAAQPAGQASGQAMQGSGGQQARGGQQAQNGASSAQQQEWQAMSQAQLRSSLEKAGYKNIRVVDAAYVVEAQGPSGEQVVMYINPPDVPRTASNAAADTTAGQGAPGQTTTGHAMPGKGSSGQ
jgi:hypothetical protein